jgi:cysteine desulfurase
LNHLQKNNLDNCLVTLILANNETGNLLNLSKIADLKLKNIFIFHTDATQALGKIPIDFKNSPMDLMSISAHKIYGPKGVGALIIRNGVKISTQMHGGNHQKGIRSGTLNVPGIVGFGRAVELSKNNLENYTKETSLLRDYLEMSLLKIPGTKLNGDKQNRLPNTTSISFADVDGELLLQSINKIAVSSGSACTSASVEPSHVLLAMGIEPNSAMASLRFSLGIYTQSDEIDFAVKHIYDVYSSLKHHI